MNIAKQIDADMRNAMKTGDKVVAHTLKMVKTDLTYEKTRTGEELSDEKALEVVMRAAKKRKEAMAEYEKAGRAELARAEKEELDVIAKYLPEQMDEGQVEEALDKIISDLGEITPKDFGKVMGIAMKELKGKAEGNIVKKVLEKKLRS